MAGVKFSKGTEEWLMFMDYWNLCQKHWIPDKSDEYWESLIHETDEFYKKYQSIPLARKLVLALVDTMDEICKENKNGKKQ